MQFLLRTRSSAVAMIADRTGIWQTIKPVSVTSLRTAGTNDLIQRVELINPPISTQAWPLSATDQSSVVYEVRE